MHIQAEFLVHSRPRVYPELPPTEEPWKPVFFKTVSRQGERFGFTFREFILAYPELPPTNLVEACNRFVELGECIEMEFDPVYYLKRERGSPPNYQDQLLRIESNLNRTGNAYLSSVRHIPPNILNEIYETFDIKDLVKTRELRSDFQMQFDMGDLHEGLTQCQLTPIDMFSKFLYNF